MTRPPGNGEPTGPTTRPRVDRARIDLSTGEPTGPTTRPRVDRARIDLSTVEEADPWVC
ncbi:hypothetical protein [Streptomyces sp. NBC_01363]|uniref:hypothetical protein n=1 Tax=Streptomyces sp. NBC_01363 TaxID=2903840 RepID=UPI00224EDEBB|nr:hypothetical protein [Streptomyces sp. NBC_01363]MCX4736401.1 hypothetical protein [Streptomyces sp. NBC_01363]